MEFDQDQHKGHAGSGPPLFGAIFMCNRKTMKECYERGLFGLPPNHANFVKNIKTGMPLFLFEHEERKLYGVFRATSDGAMNIVPKAFKSSQRQFSAQVRFGLLWDCEPVPEYDFRGAFRDNYYTLQKFGFGLSQDQVYKLLSLFSLRKRIVVRQSKNLTTSTEGQKVGRSGLGTVRVTEEGRFVTTNSFETEHSMDNDLGPLSRTRFSGSPWWANQTNVITDCGNLFLERDDLSAEGSACRSLPLPHSGEPQLSDIFCSNPGESDNPHIITPYSDSYLRDSSLLYRQPPLHFLLSDHETPVLDNTSYSNTLTGRIFPQSRSQLISTDVDRENLMPSSKRLRCPAAVTNLRDYRSTNTEFQMPEYGYFGDKTIHYNEEGNQLPFWEPSIVTTPISRNYNNERENISSSMRFVSGNGSSPIPGHDYASGGLQYLEYERATSAIPLSSDNLSQSQLVGCSEEPRFVDLDQRHGCQYPEPHKDYKGHLSRRSNTPLGTRTSVFSRLAKAKDTIGHHPNYTLTREMDMSVDQLMTVLHQTQKERRGTKKPKPTTGYNDDHADFDKKVEIETGEDADLVNKDRKFSERKGETTPLVNFKRRSEIQKEQGKTPIERSLKTFEGKSLSVTSGKRRKLVRPSFGLNESGNNKGTVNGEEGKQDEFSQNGEQKNGQSEKAVKSSSHESPKAVGAPQDLGAREGLLIRKGLHKKARISTGSLGKAEKGSSKVRKECDGVPLGNKGKEITLPLSLESIRGEDYKADERFQKLGAQDCSVNMQDLSQVALANPAVLRGMHDKGSCKSLQKFSDGSFESECERNTNVSSLISDTGEDYKKEAKPPLLGFGGCFSNAKELWEGDMVKTGGVKQIDRTNLTKIQQQLGDGFVKSEGEQIELSLESKAGWNSEEKGQSSQGKVEGFSGDALVHAKSEEEASKTVEELLSAGFSTREGKGTADATFTEPEDTDIGKTENQGNKNLTSAGVGDAETSEMLVDNGVSSDETIPKKLSSPSEHAPQQRGARRVKIVKRVKKKISSDQQPSG